MSEFRKKPVVIEAVRFIGSLDGHRAIDAFVGEAMEHEHFDDRGWSMDLDDGTYLDVSDAVALDSGGSIEIVTLEGRMEASPGDWIIRGVQGEFYACKPDIFEATYEAVEVAS